MILASQIAERWLRQILARYSPEFYQWTLRKRFPSPKSREQILFHSLPPEEQKRIHDQWQAGKAERSIAVPRKEMRRIREEAVMGPEAIEDRKKEEEAQKADRKEMAKTLKKLKERRVPPHVLTKEKRRLLREMETRRHKRQQQQAVAQTPVMPR